MTKLNIYAEWTTFIVQSVAMLFAFLQSIGIAYFSQPMAMGILAGLLAFNTFLPGWVKSAQEFAAKLEALKGVKG